MCLSYCDFYDTSLGVFMASPVASQSFHRSEHEASIIRTMILALFSDYADLLFAYQGNQINRGSDKKKKLLFTQLIFPFRG